ncbi:alpha/beta hydrolase [Paracoccus sp. TK19116]|uniref:Alpha/beta hydrolase n=1 Tax=Paracoccus albicereus TaxID=2922394 RepID=A0ABT1MSX0_9RHOB|nr:alpha/beta hydrolase [Paracoccus albicereus]MCQ0971415.1 alpha/beta hydrolase [Paracoccus albicereus]
MAAPPQRRTWTANDYALRLDPQMLGFIDATNAHYPPDTIDASVMAQRAIYDRMCTAFRAVRPADVLVEDVLPPSSHPIPLRQYRRHDVVTQVAAVLYLHGGGLVVGGLDSHDDVCAEICARTGFRVTAADYRLLPEHSYADACDDALAALRWLLDESGVPVVVVGDSAGGLLAAMAVQAMRGEARQAAGQVLIYPGLGGADDLSSRIEHAEAPMLTRAEVKAYDALRGVTAPTPLGQPDFSGLPPTVVIPAECDPLCDDAVVYDDAIRQAGGRSVCLIQQGWVHGGLRARHAADVARRAFDVAVDAIEALGHGRWPY